MSTIYAFMIEEVHRSQAVSLRHLNSFTGRSLLRGASEIVNPLPALRRPFRRPRLVRPIAPLQPGDQHIELQRKRCQPDFIPSAFSARSAIRDIT